MGIVSLVCCVVGEVRGLKYEIVDRLMDIICYLFKVVVDELLMINSFLVIEWKNVE